MRSERFPARRRSWGPDNTVLQLRILVINGPNLNNLGRRDADHYGTVTLSEVERAIQQRADELDADVSLFQSNHEGAIVDFIQESADDADGVIINAGALTHYGLSMRDALTDARLPIIEVHISNIHARDEYRRHSIIADLAVGQIAGLGWRGYVYALEFLVAHLGERQG